MVAIFMPALLNSFGDISINNHPANGGDLVEKIVADGCCYPARTSQDALVCWIACLFQGMVNLQVNLFQ
jgi:hypothetical protein